MAHLNTAAFCAQAAADVGCLKGVKTVLGSMFAAFFFVVVTLWTNFLPEMYKRMNENGSVLEKMFRDFEGCTFVALCCIIAVVLWFDKTRSLLFRKVSKLLNQLKRS